jgi:methionine-rich copper-binding protein CopC
MKTLRAAALSTLAFVALVGATPAEPAHFALRTSVPEAGSSVESPTEVRLWFTQEPQEGTTQIRIVEAESAGVHVMDVVQDADDPTSFSVEIHGTMPAGSYTVSWRGMGQDGDVVRDTFTFDVSGR